MERGVRTWGLGVVLFAMVMSGARAEPLAPQVLADLKERPVGMTVYPVPGFSSLTRGGAATAVLLGGILGAMIASRAGGSEFVTTHGLEDPAPKMALALAAALGGTPAEPARVAADENDDPAQLAGRATNADWLLDVRTLGWSYGFPLNAKSGYVVDYRARLRVVDVATRNVLAQTECAKTLGTERRPSVEQLMADNALLIKHYVQQAQFACTQEFARTVFGLPDAPRLEAALESPLAAIRVDDLDAIPDLFETGKNDYREWLKLPSPKAFAIAGNGRWGYAAGPMPRDPAAPIETGERALWNCERNSKQACVLYAVNGKVVWGSEYAGQLGAAFERRKAGGNLRPEAVPPMPVAEPAAAAPTPSGFAKLDEVDLVPYLTDTGREGYRKWLAAPAPKAFVVAGSAHWDFAVGAVANGAPPLARALAACAKRATSTCKPYAVDDKVVYVRD